jgi:deoxyadenosine/deoxycytidine kinase
MIIGISGKIGSGKDTVGKIIQYLTSRSYQDIGKESFENFNKRVTQFKGNDNQRWKIHKFADKLKDIVCLLIGCTREQLEDQDFKNKELSEEWNKYQIYNWGKPQNIWFCLEKEALDYVKLPIKSNSQTSLSYVKETLTPRYLLQNIGTDLFRNELHQNIWVNALMNDYYYENGITEDGNNIIVTEHNWIITDCRFENELRAIKDRGGISIRVNREIKHQIEALKGSTNIPKGYFPTYQHESEIALDNAVFDYVIDNDSDINSLIEKVKEILIKEKLI